MRETRTHCREIPRTRISRWSAARKPHRPPYPFPVFELAVGQRYNGALKQTEPVRRDGLGRRSQLLPCQMPAISKLNFALPFRRISGFAKRIRGSKMLWAVL